MVTILSVFGTRPEVIKLAPLLKAFEQHPHRIRSVVCSTGQHREMLASALEVFALAPDFELEVMRPDQGLAALTASLLSGLDAIVQTVHPDWILAVGDTTTVFVASLLAYYHRVSFGHVEAGLRTGDRFNPYPEEINRRVADLVADAFFAPTECARQNLLREGYPEHAIYVTGNPVVDALLEITAQPYDWSSSTLATLPDNCRIVLITAHRRESFGAPFRELCLAIRDLAARFEGEGVRFVYPVHLNPNVQQPVYDLLSGLPNVTLLEPLDYRSMVHLMKRSTLILTDSGGIQEEAPTFSVPVLVMREATERPEGIEAGVARLVGMQRHRIVAEAERLLRDPAAYAEMASGVNPYGDGRAAHRITSILLERAS
jgi:UDP-N-acetylglucosamine 2-epimerase (non-hydrolysing)